MVVSNDECGSKCMMNVLGVFVVGLCINSYDGMRQILLVGSRVE